MKNGIPQVKTLYDLYRILNLPVELIQPYLNFTILNLKDVGFTLPYTSPSFRPEYFSFLFIKKGEGHYTIDEHSFTVETHSIYFTNPSNYRTFAWSEIEEIYLITFDETFLKEYVNQQIFEEFTFLLTETVSPKVVEKAFYKEVEIIYLLMHQEYNGYAIDKYKVIGHLLAVLLYKIRGYFWHDYNPLDEGSRGSQIVKSFKQLLEKHYRDLNAGTAEHVFRVQDYADALKLNASYLTNVIKIKTGKSITAWIADKTISEAKSLLQNTSIAVKEVAWRLGFSETAHFSNYFKKRTGISPVQYRKEANIMA
jgi:AraC family transcriptional regulator, transcriptional activator of pobA